MNVLNQFRIFHESLGSPRIKKYALIARMTTIDTPSPIWNIRDCDTLVHNRHTPDLEHQGLRHSVDDWAPVCQKPTKSVNGCV